MYISTQKLQSKQVYYTFTVVQTWWYNNAIGWVLDLDIMFKWKEWRMSNNWLLCGCSEKAVKAVATVSFMTASNSFNAVTLWGRALSSIVSPDRILCSWPMKWNWFLEYGSGKVYGTKDTRGDVKVADFLELRSAVASEVKWMRLMWRLPALWNHLADGFEH